MPGGNCRACRQELPRNCERGNFGYRNYSPGLRRASLAGESGVRRRLAYAAEALVCVAVVLPRTDLESCSAAWRRSARASTAGKGRGEAGTEHPAVQASNVSCSHTGARSITLRPFTRSPWIAAVAGHLDSTTRRLVLQGAGPRLRSPGYWQRWSLMYRVQSIECKQGLMMESPGPRETSRPSQPRRQKRCRHAIDPSVHVIRQAHLRPPDAEKYTRQTRTPTRRNIGSPRRDNKRGRSRHRFSFPGYPETRFRSAFHLPTGETRTPEDLQISKNRQSADVRASMPVC